ncbi:hypothetical protein G6F32_014008 [Rhizopus arrhizus]|nr:hypothetical protein G6F32_014008 [Rhizopus arrhizus]
MGAAGTGTAIETADVALMDDDLRKIGTFLRLSRATHRVLIQNITLALGIKVVFLTLAMTGQATLWMAVFADVGASLLVVANGLRLLRAAARKTDGRASARLFFLRPVAQHGRIRRAGADITQGLVLQQRHAIGVAISAVGETLFLQQAFDLEAAAFVHVHGRDVVLVHYQVDLVQVQHAERVAHRDAGRRFGVAPALIAGRDDDLEFSAAVDVVDFYQLHQAGRLAGVVLDDETPLVLAS